ncbi:MAG: hypothetical protein E6J69_02230 [Deltaproteobacteria bacterium]|nr:MAG: hypothetical protein E6J69_02230 [Deltaproteobacteria bacterium]
MFALIALLVFVSLALGGYGIAGVLRGRDEERRALERRLTGTGGASAAPLHPSVLRDRRLSAIALLNDLLEHSGLARRLVAMVRQAGLRRRVGEVVLYIPLLGSAGFMLAMLITASVPIALAASAAGGSIPLLVLRRLRRKRTLRFSEQLPDALDLIRAALQAGHGFLSALSVVADEFPDPVAQEVRDVAEEVRLGLPLRDALSNLAERVDDPNLPILVVGVLLSQEVGGNLAEVLDNVGYTIRERFKLLREVQVLTAQARFSGRVLTALPFLVGLAMITLNPGYFAPMLERQGGHYLLAYGLASILCGHMVIRRLVRIRV